MTNHDTDTNSAAPYCRIVNPDDHDQVIALTMQNGAGESVVGQLTAAEARDITLALRACAADIDGKPFFDGGWNTAEAVRYAADELEELSEQYQMRTRNLENANFEWSRADPREGSE